MTLEIKRNISYSGQHAATYILTLLNGKYVWYLCREHNRSCPHIIINRLYDFNRFYIPFEPSDLEL